SLPTTKRYVIATRRDDQRELELNVFQGDSDRVADDEYLGTLKLSGLPKGPRGSIQIEVGFEVSNESLLRVSARELSTGKEVSAHPPPPRPTARAARQDDAPQRPEHPSGRPPGRGRLQREASGAARAGPPSYTGRNPFGCHHRRYHAFGRFLWVVQTSLCARM